MILLVMFPIYCLASTKHILTKWIKNMSYFTYSTRNSAQNYVAAWMGGEFREECVCMCVCVCVLSRVWLFATPQTVTHQAPLSMGFSSQEYWSRLPSPSPGDLPNPGTESTSPASPALAGGFFTTSTTMDICICMTESLWSSPEDITALFIGYTPIQNKTFKLIN